MSIFRLGDQAPPEPQRITDDVVMRFEHVYEVDPAQMELTGQQDMPAWDTQRIVAAAGTTWTGCTTTSPTRSWPARSRRPCRPTTGREDEREDG